MPRHPMAADAAAPGITTRASFAAETTPNQLRVPACGPFRRTFVNRNGQNVKPPLPRALSTHERRGDDHVLGACPAGSAGLACPQANCKPYARRIPGPSGTLMDGIDLLPRTRAPART
jgi:hypothetical protein